MNEAARMVEEGVASVEDIDKATKYGFGFRFAVLGLLESVKKNDAEKYATFWKSFGQVLKEGPIVSANGYRA